MEKLFSRITPQSMAKAEADIRADVNALSNLDEEQRKRLFDIAWAYARTNNRRPHYGNLSQLVRTTKATPTTHKAFPRGAW